MVAIVGVCVKLNESSPPFRPVRLIEEDTLRRTSSMRLEREEQKYSKTEKHIGVDELSCACLAPSISPNKQILHLC